MACVLDEMWQFMADVASGLHSSYCNPDSLFSRRQSSSRMSLICYPSAAHPWMTVLRRWRLQVLFSAVGAVLQPKGILIAFAPSAILRLL